MGITTADTTESATEIEFELRDRGCFFVDASAIADCRIELEHLINRSDGRLLEYFTVEGAAPDRIRSLAEATDAIDETRPISRGVEGVLFEFVVSGPCVTTTLADTGAIARSISAENGVGDVLADVPDDAVIPVDVGNNTYAFGRYFEPAGQSVLMSGYLGSIGFAFPAALGAWAATREPESRFAGRKVVSVSSDGGFGQYMSEFTTAVKYDMDITHVLLNDDELGKISKEQRTGGWDVWQTGLVNPEFAAFAENCGGRGVAVDEPAELDDALSEAIAYDGPALVEILTDSDPV